MAENKGKKSGKGISIRNLNLSMAAITLVISALLLVATYSAYTGYSKLRDYTENYIHWQRDAYDLQTGSDYLTEQVRCFVETGKRVYLDNYFEEAEVNRRRDSAVENVHNFLGDTEAYRALVAAMAESVDLMDREYYAMRLTIEAFGKKLSEYPEVIQAVELSPEDAALPNKEKAALARSMVFDDIYHSKKNLISDNMQQCLQALALEIDGQQEATADGLTDILNRQRMLIVLSISITLFTMLLTLLLIISPLVRAVMYIRAEQPIPVKGSKEFQFLARTYNLMYETNREQKEELAYEATHDNLTGVYNRNGYDFIQRNTNWETSALVLFDVDRFKPVNDTYGHKMGDRVLARVAITIQNAFRAQDFVCRIGGDEFAVIMVHTNPSSAELICKKVERINEVLGEPEGGVPGIHISCGAAYGVHFTDFDRLFHEADAALYRVKNSGGGRCEVCGQP